MAPKPSRPKRTVSEVSDPKSKQTASKRTAPSATQAPDGTMVAATTASTSTTVAPPPEEKRSEIVQGVRVRLTIPSNPNFESLLVNRGELGYWRPTASKILENTVITIDAAEIRRTMSGTFKRALTALYHTEGSMRTTAITTEIDLMVPIVVDVCMSALYAKLRNIHRSYGVHPTRYATAPSYSKEIELPLPFALLIQEIGTFETVCLPTNTVYIPTFAEGIQNEGRANAAYRITNYLSYLPTLRELGVPLKSVDVFLKTGSPWWTYQVSVESSLIDLACTLPPSNYTDFSVILRSLLLFETADAEFGVNDIITVPDNAATFGFRLKAQRKGINVRSFFALCHCPDEFWCFSQG